MTSVFRAWPWLGAGIASLGLVAACTTSPGLGATPPSAIASDPGPGWHTTPIPSPPGSAVIRFTALACTSPDQCAAVGTYTKKIDFVPFVMTDLTAGRRPVMVPLRMPSTAVDTDVNDLACASPGYCVAVGIYRISAGTPYGFTVTESGGRWAAARTIALPAGATVIQGLNGVACTSPGNCVAVGGVSTATALEVPIVLTESGGTWGRAAYLSPPPGFAPKGGADLASVACASAGSCVAAGSYAVVSGLLAWPMAVVESGGQWLRAQRIPLPADANRTQKVGAGGLSSVSCARDGPCLAVGGYIVASGAPNHGLVITEQNGHFRQPAEMPQDLFTVTCVPAFCMVTTRPGRMLSYASGRWSQLASIQPPASVGGVALRNDSRGREHVACLADGQCVAVGTFTDNRGRGSFLVSTRS